MSLPLFFGLLTIVNAIGCVLFIAGWQKGKNDTWQTVIDWRDYYESRVAEINEQSRTKYGHDCNLHK